MNTINKIFDYLLNRSPKWLETITSYVLCAYILVLIYIGIWVFGSDGKSGKLLKYKIKNGKLFTKQKGLINIFTKWEEK